MARASHLERETLLENPTRAAVVRRLGESPGLPLAEILGRIRSLPGFETASQSNLAWHVRVLEKFGLVTSRRAGWWRRYYMTGGPAQGHFTALAVLQAPKPLAIAQAVAEFPGIDPAGLFQEFRARFPISRQSMARYLRQMEEAGLVVAETCAGRRSYAPSPGLAPLLAACGRRMPPARPAPPQPSLPLIVPGAATAPGSSPSPPTATPLGVVAF